MKILGVDPGTWHTGAGVLEARGNRYQLLHFEVINLPKHAALPDRLLQIYRTLGEMIRIYQPSVMALESVFYCKDIRATVKIGEARAAAMLAASERGIPVVEYPPARVKQAVTGNGKATKEQVQHMMQRLLQLKELPPSDGADALAVALCHLHCGSVKKNELLDGLHKRPSANLKKKLLAARAAS